MIHDIGIVIQLVKSPLARIDAVGVNVISPYEDIANARLTFENGAVANLNVSRISLKKVRELRVFQQGAYLSIDFMNQSGHSIRMPEGKTIFDIKKEDLPIEKGEPLAIELASFVKCVRDNETPKVSSALGKSALEIAIRITEMIRANMGKPSTENL
jgi:predicted dehydrogenase